MPSLERDSHRIVIAGASSLLGVELKSLLEESRFAAADFRLVDEEVAAGTLTEASGEAAIIQPVEEGSFSRASHVFFTGSAEFTRRNLSAAKNSGANIIDLSGGAAGDENEETVAWFPKLDGLLGREFPKDERLFSIPSVAATQTSVLALALIKLGLIQLITVHFRPVSEAGRAGVEELESQTSQLLSFQSIGQPVFDTQVAFNLLDRYGASSREKLETQRNIIRSEVKACIALTKRTLPAIQLIHAPVFYGGTFTACATVDVMSWHPIVEVCREAGFVVSDDEEFGPSNVSVAGEKSLFLSKPQEDHGTWWFWGAADNIRLPAANAVKLAEALS